MTSGLPDSNIDHYRLDLVKIVAATSYLAHPATVQMLCRAVFPAVRSRNKTPRFSTKCWKLCETNCQGDCSSPVAMYDDNTTPRWALLWAHGYKIASHPSGWTFAHVWTAADDIDSYTHLANIVMVPEPLAGLTDKEGPLTSYLKYHAFAIYGWKPKDAPVPVKPDSYDDIIWQYLSENLTPNDSIKTQVNTLNNKRLRILKPIMEKMGML
jgi:hypothetical protein